MKKIISLAIIAITMILAVSSCTKKKDDNTSSNLNNIVQQGTWKITSYIDSGKDETSRFSGYEFQFNSNGTVTANKSGSAVNGTWSSGNDDSQLKMILNFGTTPVLEELNDDWHVIEQNSSIIKLEDVSGGGGGTDYLTFQKI